MYARHTAGPSSGGSHSGHSGPRTGAKRPFSSSSSRSHSSPRPSFGAARPSSGSGYQGSNPRPGSSAPARHSTGVAHSAHRAPAAGGSRFSSPRGGAGAGFSRGGSSAPSRGGFSGGPRKSFGGNRRGGSGGGGGGRRGGGFRGERIDFSRFVKKAEKVEEKAYVPTHTFNDFPFSEQLKKNIAKKGFVHPTPIQDQSILPIIEGRDFFGLANTGTGKTGAFILPLIDRVAKDKKQKVLIMAPTRELAQQIEVEFRALSFFMQTFSVSAVGGMPIDKQIREIKRGVSFVIGTPGRIVDLVKRKALDLSQYSNIVLDEADRMLDMGFRDDMLFILKNCAPERQTLFFSATLSTEIKKITEQYLKNPLFISVVKSETSKNIDQDIVRATRGEKIDVLHNILIKDGSDKVLIFRETKRSVDELEKELKTRGFKIAGIHGDKRNRERMRTLEAFKKGEINILIATDVAARGLDIPNVTHVINYDIPNDYDTYVHRIGRTGRAGNKGNSITFVPA
jgi:ATP-dependent RNA helicase RhlE